MGLQVQPRPAAAQQESRGATIHRWYSIYNVTRPRELPWRSAPQNTRPPWSRSPAGRRSYCGTSQRTRPCPQPTTTQTSRRRPAVTPSRPFAAVTRWDEGRDNSQARDVHGCGAISLLSSVLSWLFVDICRF